MTQEVLLRLHRGLGGLRSAARLDAFAYRIARTAIIDYYRSRASGNEATTEERDLTAYVGEIQGRLSEQRSVA